MIVLLAEGDGDKKGRFQVRIIRAGLSGNGHYYPDAVLREAAGAFEGARVFAKSDEDHLRFAGRDVRNLVGRIGNVAFMPGDAPDTGELQGELTLIEPDGPMGRMLREAAGRGMAELFGLSISAYGEFDRPRRIGAKLARAVKRIGPVESVDLIARPAAGGQIIKLIESQGSPPMEDDENDILNADGIRRIVEAAPLPPAAKQKLIAEADETSDGVTETVLREAIDHERDYLAQAAPGGQVTGLGADGPRIALIESRGDKAAQMLDAFFDPDDRSVVSIRECYIDLTGDRRFTGLTRNCDRALLRESLESTSLGDVLGDSIARRLVAEYENDSVFDVWRRAATVVPVSDFRTQERARFGGYGDLPTVAEAAAYGALTSPTDEKATYAVAKHGGTEDITLEMITNDDVGAVQRIPRKLVRAAKRTLSKFVLDHLKDNPVVYDDVALFHATHKNLGAAALSGAAVAAGRLAIKSQTERDSNEKIGIGPRTLWVPDELEETAVNLFRRNTENDRTFVQSLSLDVAPVWYWTDANDWCLTADPMDIPTLEIGFLAGREEPELFVQDLPTQGSMFSHDKITFKIRHVYGGAVTDYRGAYKSVVA